jgi:hypothetical protein
MPGWLTLIVLLLGVWILFRILRGLFGAMSGGYNRPPMPMGGPGGPPPGAYGGYGGYGGGYGPRGGGFWSGLFGGLGGSLLGNWMYDRYNRPEGHYPAGGHLGGGFDTSQTPDAPQPTSFGGADDSIVGSQDDAGASWGGNDDAGTGGDWGGGGDGGGGGGGDW